MSTILKVENLEKYYGGKGNITKAVNNISFEVSEGEYCKRILFLKDGKLFNEIIRGTESRKEFFDRIMEVIALLGGDLNAD